MMYQRIELQYYNKSLILHKTLYRHFVQNCNEYTYKRVSVHVNAWSLVYDIYQNILVLYKNLRPNGVGLPVIHPGLVFGGWSDGRPL